MFFYGNYFIMLKTIKHILLIFILILPLHVFSQYSFLSTATQKEVHRLNEIINKALKKYKTYSIEDTTTQLFILYNFRIMDSISKNELLDGSFLQKLMPINLCYRKYRYNPTDPNPKCKDTLLYATTFIYYSDEKEIASFSYHKKVFVRYKNENYYRPHIYDEVVKLLWNKKNLFIFDGTPILGDCNTYFIVNEQLEIFVLFNEFDVPCKMSRSNEPDGHFNVLPIKEFIDQYWDRFLKRNGSILTD